MTLTKAGARLPEEQGSLKIAVFVTITIPGQKKILEHREVTVVLKGPRRSIRAPELFPRRESLTIRSPPT